MVEAHEITELSRKKIHFFFLLNFFDNFNLIIYQSRFVIETSSNFLPINCIYIFILYILFILFFISSQLIVIF